MKHKGILSSAFNMSLGFIPVILVILLCQLIAQDIALYVGTGVSLLYGYFYRQKRGARVPQFILLISTIVLVALSLATLIPLKFIPAGVLPLTLEVSILIPMLILYLHKKKFIRYHLQKKDTCHRFLFAQGAESAIVSARIVLILGAIHFAIISITILLADEFTHTDSFVLFHLLPLVLFFLCIFFNHWGIRYFNSMMSHMEYVAIVNTQGDVIGKSLAMEAVNYKNTYINPVIRIAVISKGMLFLCNRTPNNILDNGKTDIPLECYLRFGETLTQGANRIIQNVFPDLQGLKPSFNIKHHFENKITNRLVYLFILELKDDIALFHPRFENGKLWRFQQIEQNLGQAFFGDCFEKEYEHLKDVICIREKYKVS